MIAVFPNVTMLRIEPLDGGWALICGYNDLIQIFRSGAVAERQARRYAKALTRCGFAPRLAIQDRAGHVISARL
jgi:hypothetical protein